LIFVNGRFIFASTNYCLLTYLWYKVFKVHTISVKDVSKVPVKVPS